MSQIEVLREKVLNIKTVLSKFFVEKDEILELMIICTLAQEPLLILGDPGTAKSDIITKFCEAVSIQGTDYFEYMLTKFTEPSEILGPPDIGELKTGKYIRRIEGKLPAAKIVFLDEVFKANSAILNTLLTIINERKFYQDGKAIRVPLKMVFGASNDLPATRELDALKDRFILKCESPSVREDHFENLIWQGLRNDNYKTQNKKPWKDICNLEDFIELKSYFDINVSNSFDNDDTSFEDKKKYFPTEVFNLFRRIIRSLEKEDRIVISDRKVIKLYKLIRMRAFLYHGGTVEREDLKILKYVGDTYENMSVVREKVSHYLTLED